MRSRIRTGLFFPMDIPSAPISSAVWRYTQLIWNDLCQLVQGFLDIQDWRRPTQHWKRVKDNSISSKTTIQKGQKR